jgi:aromatic-L-amino-acid decarboxylase
MKEEILQLESLSRLLEPTAAERNSVRTAVIDYTEGFLRNVEKSSAYEDKVGDGKFEETKALLSSPITDGPTPIGELIQLLEENVDSTGLNPASAGHLGYIPGGGLYYSALGDYMADIFNRYAGLYSTGPGAVRMENMLLRWMAEVVGYPQDAGGNLTTGGSLAHLIAIATARDAKEINSADVPRSVVYVSRQAHRSIDKALRIAGLGECRVRRIALDGRYRMIATALEEQIELDMKKGFTPFLAVASAGTTDVGSIDPLEDIGAICRRYQLWYHVDAAYGGFFALTVEGKEKLRGLEVSDSLVMDPHKGLFLPYGLGAVLVKDKMALKKSFYSDAANYLQDDRANNTEPSPAEYSPELTKHFRGLRLWLPLKLHGVKPFRSCLEEKLLLAKYFYSEIEKCGFEVGPEPDLSVVTYRYVPERLAGNLEAENKFNEELLKRVKEDGQIYISSTVLDRKFVLRFACLSFRTHLKTVELLLETLKEKVAELEKAYHFDRTKADK